MWKIKPIQRWKKIAYALVLIAVLASISRINFTFRVNDTPASNPSDSSPEVVVEEPKVSDCSRIARDTGQVAAFQCLKNLDQPDFLNQVGGIYVSGYSPADVAFFEEQIRGCEGSSCSPALAVYLSSVVLRSKKKCGTCEKVLVDALSSPDSQIRYFAAGTFAYINDPARVDTLVSAFGREDDPGTLRMLGHSINTLNPRRFETLLKECEPWKAALFSST